MSGLEIQLSEKQMLGLQTINDPQVTEIFWGGGAGGGKSLLVCIWMLLELRNYPGIRIGLGRKELSRLKQTTLVTLMREAHQMLNIRPESFNYHDQKGLVKYRNGSEIQLVDLVQQPSDPDFDTLGSLNLTHVVIEEAGEIKQKAKNVFGSRKNRFLNKEYGIVGKTVVTGNPSQNFIYQDYYEPYKRLGMGDMRRWETGQVEVEGVMMPAYTAFVKSLPTDNPFLPRNYIEVLKSLPPQERRRLFEGNWDYKDDGDLLFTTLLIDRSLAGETEDGTAYIGVDVADKGKDKTVVTLARNGIVVEQKRLTVDTTGEKAISEAYAMELIKFAQQRGFTAQDARRIGLESNGVGVGMRDFMRSRGWFISEYTATAQSRSAAYYDMAKHMDNGKLRIHSQMESLGELRKQLMTITFEFNDKLEPRILEKKKIKEILGYSPDEADSLMICDWVQNQQGGKRVIF